MSRAGEQHEIGQSADFFRAHRCRPDPNNPKKPPWAPSSGNRGCSASTDAHGTLSVGRRLEGEHDVEHESMTGRDMAERRAEYAPLMPDPIVILRAARPIALTNWLR